MGATKKEGYEQALRALQVEIGGKFYYPVEQLPNILLIATGKAKGKYFRELCGVYFDFYTDQAWNIKKIKPNINSNPSERNALWSIAKQLEDLHGDNKPNEDYTPEIASALFKSILDSASRHKFLKDKISLHLVNKFMNDLVKMSVSAVSESSFGDFSHINK